MAYLGWEAHDVIEDECLEPPRHSLVVYVDFTDEDEAYRFKSMAFGSDRLDEEIARLARMACDCKEW